MYFEFNKESLHFHLHWTLDYFTSHICLISDIYNPALNCILLWISVVDSVILMCKKKGLYNIALNC